MPRDYSADCSVDISMVFPLWSAIIWDEATGNGYLYDRAGTGSAGDFGHGWSMDVHYSR